MWSALLSIAFVSKPTDKSQLRVYEVIVSLIKHIMRHKLYRLSPLEYRNRRIIWLARRNGELRWQKQCYGQLHIVGEKNTSHMMETLLHRYKREWKSHRLSGDRSHGRFVHAMGTVHTNGLQLQYNRLENPSKYTVVKNNVYRNGFVGTSTHTYQHHSAFHSSSTLSTTREHTKTAYLQ